MRKWLLAGVIALSGIVGPALAQDRHRELVTMEAGEEREVFGTSFRAEEPTTAIFALTSEMVTAAVLSGALSQGNSRAREGEALVTAIDGQGTRRYGFDAQRLSASLPIQWQSAAEPPLAALYAHQQRRAFWGLIEPVGVNAAAPIAPEAEAFRRAYLGNSTVLALRQKAAGDRAALATLTVQRFAEAAAAGDAAVLADLIDPMPFSEANPDPARWQAARAAFAAQLAADGSLARALATPATASAGNPDSFELGGTFRIALVMRDRAMFVAAVEPIR